MWGMKWCLLLFSKGEIRPIHLGSNVLFHKKLEHQVGCWCIKYNYVIIILRGH